MTPGRLAVLTTRPDRLSRHRVAVALALGLVGFIAAATAASGDTRLDPTGALLHAPSDSRVVTLAPDAGCQTLLGAGTGDCGIVHAAGGDLVFTVEPATPPQAGLVSRPWTVTIFRPSTTIPNGWQVALMTTPQGGESGPLFANLTAKIADLTGDGRQSLVVGYRAEGTGELLDVDIVVGTRSGPRVAAHHELDKGVVQVLPGRLVTYEPVYLPHDANCCPTVTRRDTIRSRAGTFVVTPGPRVPTKRITIPAGDLG